MDQMGDHMKMIFWVLSNSEIKITNRAVKVDVICLFPLWVMVLKLSKKVRFFQFWADLSKKSNPI